MGSAGTSLRRTGISATEGLFEPCKGLLCSFLALSQELGVLIGVLKCQSFKPCNCLGFSVTKPQTLNPKTLNPKTLNPKTLNP